MNAKEIFDFLNNKNLLKRVCLKSIKQNQEGYIWLEIKEAYYNFKTATLIRDVLNKNKLYNVYICNHDSLKETVLNTKKIIIK